MERENCNNEHVNGMNSLRMTVRQIVSQTYEEGSPFQESGVRIKGEIDMFISCHRSQLSQYVPVGPNYRLNSETIMLERVVLQKKAIASSMMGWFELKSQQVVSLGAPQAEKYVTWFTHSGVILNAIENNLTYNKSKNTLS